MPLKEWESRLIADGGRICRYCGAGCKCGRCICDQGTCIMCGHGLAMEIGEVTALHPRVRWTTEASMVRAVRIWVRNNARPPTALDWFYTTSEHPSAEQVVTMFKGAGWDKLMTAAGCEVLAA